jgi:gliding motility-associated-like protein
VRLTFTDQQKCVTYINKDNAICVGARADFTLGPSKCIGDTSFISNGSESGTHFKWSVFPKDGAIFVPSDTLREPSIIYLRDTCVTVYMKVTKPLGNTFCENTISRTKCLTFPRARFSSGDTNLYCSPSAVRFLAESKKIQTYIWNFGDGSAPLVTESPNAAHVYLENNVKGYNVKLKIIDSLGCVDSTTKMHFIKILGPVPKFSIDTSIGCDSLTVHFKNTSDNVGKYLMQYGDASADSNAVQSSHTYTLEDVKLDSMIFNPTIVAVDNTNCKAFHKDTIILYKGPHADFVADSVFGCVPMRVHFRDTSYHSNSWLWDLDGDGLIDDSTKDPVFTYTKPGKYTVTLITANGGICKDTKIKTDFIEVSPLPEAHFTADAYRFCDKKRVSFTNDSKNFATFSMDYGDSTPIDSNVLAPHLYYYSDQRAKGADSVVFYPEIAVYSGAGCFNTYRDSITVFANPAAGFYTNATEGCNPLTVHFTDTSSHAAAWNWDFNNDGIIDAKVKDTSWTFGPGFYTVKLVTYSASGCIDSVVKVNLIHVNPIPVADFSPDDSITCVGGTVHFTDRSTSKANIRKWYWKFNEPRVGTDSSFVQNPDFTFYTQGYHTVSLIAEDDLGCRDTISKKSVYVEDTLPPPNSQILYVTQDDAGHVSVVWSKNHVYDFKDYRLSRTDLGSLVLHTSSDVNDTTYQDTDPNADARNQSYCYHIQTEDKCDNVSLNSPDHCSILLQATAVGNSTIGLSWNAYSGWAPLTYVIYRNDNNGTFRVLDSTTNTSYTDSSLCDQEYCYYVVAIHPNRTYFSRSNNACAKAPYVFQDNILEMQRATVAENSYVKLNWSSASQTNFSNYLVDRYSSEDKDWKKGYAVTRNTSLEDHDVNVFANSYLYRVRTEDECGYTSGYSNNGSSILLRNKIVNDKVNLYWNKYNVWPSGVNAYLVQIQERNKKFHTVAQLPGNDSTFIDDSVYSYIDTAYCYRVIALENAPLNQDTSVSNITCAILGSRIFIPNAFTPGNEDSLNDEWKVSALAIYNLIGQPLHNFKARIYDRWGQLVFETDDVNKGWDGTRKSDGQLCPVDVYLYMIDAEGIDGRSIHLKGNVTLIR